MTERFCKNCNKMCHCTDKTKNDCDCDNCQCGSTPETYKELEQDRAEQSTYENNSTFVKDIGVTTTPFNKEGLIVDDTGECESCQ